VKLNLNQSFPRKTRAQILVLEPSHLLVIPETDENGVDFSRMSLIDTTNSMVPIAEDLDIEVTGLPLQVLHPLSHLLCTHQIGNGNWRRGE